jgi:hypothetical protein
MVDTAQTLLVWWTVGNSFPGIYLNKAGEQGHQHHHILDVLL